MDGPDTWYLAGYPTGRIFGQKNRIYPNEYRISGQISEQILDIRYQIGINPEKAEFQRSLPAAYP